MNKKQNKSVKKTKHRVQKTKRSQRLNKNRSIKGIRSNNNTKIVEKRRKIVQRGGARIDDLVRRIFGLDKITVESERNTEIKGIIDNVSVDNTQERTPIEIGDRIVNEGMTLLYAACRLVNPSIVLVQGILNKMTVSHDRVSIGSLFKTLTKAPRGVSMRKIIPNGSSNGSYPQHGAIQAARLILEDARVDIPTKHRKILEIIEILNLLKNYDNEQRKTSGDDSRAPTLMQMKNKLPDGNSYTAFEESDLKFGGRPSVRDLILTTFKHLEEQFNTVLEKPKPQMAPTFVFYPPPSFELSTPDQRWEKRFDRELNKPFWYNSKTKILTWDDPAVAAAAAAAAPPPPPPPAAAAAASNIQTVPYDNKLLGLGERNGAGVQELRHDGSENHFALSELDAAAMSSGRQYVPPPRPWEILLDGYGRPYYFNTETSESKWVW